MSVYGYIRVSTAKQAHSELGLQAQTRMIRDYCRLKKLRLNRVYADKAVSAFRRGMPDRPQGAVMIEALQAGDHIVIARMDRAFRSVIDFADTLAFSTPKELLRVGIVSYVDRAKEKK